MSIVLSFDMIHTSLTTLSICERIDILQLGVRVLRKKAVCNLRAISFRIQIETYRISEKKEYQTN